MLTGLAGEKWAKENGHSDGEMPMHVYVEDDIEPCDECKKKGIALVAIIPGDPLKYTGDRWLVTEAFIERLVGKRSEFYKRAMEQRVMLIDSTAAAQIRLPRGETK